MSKIAVCIGISKNISAKIFVTIIVDKHKYLTSRMYIVLHFIAALIGQLLNHIMDWHTWYIR